MAIFADQLPQPRPEIPELAGIGDVWCAFAIVTLPPLLVTINAIYTDGNCSPSCSLPQRREHEHHQPETKCRVDPVERSREVWNSWSIGGERTLDCRSNAATIWATVSMGNSPHLASFLGSSGGRSNYMTSQHHNTAATRYCTAESDIRSRHDQCGVQHMWLLTAVHFFRYAIFI